MINLLITGGCGFIGSNFINYIFSKNNYKIVNIDAMYYCANENNVNENIRTSDNYILKKGNLCDFNFVEDVIKKYNITHIIHFAAQSHVQNSFEDSISFTHDNILGTHTLLEVCRKYGKIERFIHVSTDEVYGESMLESDEKHKTEHSVLCPSNPYAATKAGAELIAQSYYHSFKLPIIISRGNNVYGPNQYPEKLIPRFINLLQNNEKVTIQGDGSNVRAFLHAYDTASAFECILTKGKIGEIYNIGCDENMEYSVLEVAKILIKMIKNTTEYNDWIKYIEDRPFNDKRYYISNEKVKNLGWNITINFIDGLQKLLNNSIPKIDTSELKLLQNFNELDIFGDWFNQTNEEILFDKYNNEPFNNIIINNFLNEEYANKLSEIYPTNLNEWYEYKNPIEYKYTYDKINNLPEELKNIFYYLSTDKVINKLSKITNIPNLEFDPYLHGAGLHVYPRNGKLDVHLDYEKHPITGKERRVNIILYLNKEWKPEWNGETELWNKDVSECIKSPVKFNTAIIFQTNDISYHGVSKKILCPEDVYRKSIAYYYVSPLESKANINKLGAQNDGYRLKASFIKKKDDPYCEKIQKLYNIRPYRLITEKDIEMIYPSWSNDNI